MARIWSSDVHDDVTMPRPVSRLTNIEIPMQPSMPVTAGITSSRTYLMPSSIRAGSPWIDVERAYITAHLILRGGAPVAPPVVPISSRPG